MNSDRINNLENILQTDPNDTFARYALGLEYMSLKDFCKAREMFEELKTLDPNYAATYYQLGKTYEQLGDENEARKIYEKGIFVSASQSDFHTKEELEQALNDLL